MEINGTHGEFHVRAGRDEKLKNYFAWPNILFVFKLVDLFCQGAWVGDVV